MRSEEHRVPQARELWRGGGDSEEVRTRPNSAPGVPKQKAGSCVPLPGGKAANQGAKK